MSYSRPSKALEISHIIKKSHFIGHLAIVKSKQEALDYVKAIKAQHPQANHSCHCFMATNPEDSSAWGYSDDGEPKGTAGLPMFQVLKHANLGNVCIVVTRYFGGVKLGTGGIARAYSAIVSMLIEQVETQLVIPSTKCSLFVPFHLTGFVELLFKRYSSITLVQRDWTESGQSLIFTIDSHLLAQLSAEISQYQSEIILVKAL